MNADQLAEIEERAEAAYPAPWKAWDRGIGHEVHTHHDEPLNYNHRETFGKADAEFIAHARTDVPALLALVREQAAKLEAVRDVADEWEMKAGPKSSAAEVFGPQKVSVEFAVRSIRAALEPTP